MKKLAILVPSYNSVTTLEGTLRSILSLSGELERHIDFVMLSDDGSTDDTVGLAERTWNHPTVPLQIRRAEKNIGEYRNVNGAFAAMPAHIEWVLIMHADNRPLPGWIDVLARECARAGEKTATICSSWKNVLDGVINVEGDTRGPDHVEVVPGDDAALRGTLFKGCWWNNSTAAIRVAAWIAVGGHPQGTPLLGFWEVLGVRAPSKTPVKKLRIKGDWDTLLRFLSSGYEVRYVAAPLILYYDALITSVSTGSFAWHGDVLETLQVMRRHQAVFSLADILKYHAQVGANLLRRTAACLIRGQWRRVWFGIEALPVVVASLCVSLLNRQREVGGRLKSIPFQAEWNAP